MSSHPATEIILSLYRQYGITTVRNSKNAAEAIFKRGGSEERRKPVRRAIREKLYVKQGGICAGCKQNFPISYMEVDHIQPLALGGLDYITNMQLLCGPKGNSCNQKKSAKDMIQLSKEGRGTILQQLT